MRPEWLGKFATVAARKLLLAGAVALLLVAWSGVAMANPPGGGGDDVPEINPGLMGSAATLLAGGVLLLRDRLRGR
jgi:hypothetical protein